MIASSQDKQLPFSYYHQKSAGSKGDLWKHYLLLLACKQWQDLDQTISVLDSHGGSGVYDLQPGHYWQTGIKLLADQTVETNYITLPNYDLISSWCHRYCQQSSYWGSWSNLLMVNSKLRVTLCDHNPNIIRHAQINANKLNLQDRLTLVEADSFDYIANTSHQFDFVFIDPAYCLKDGKGDDWQKLLSVAQSLLFDNQSFLCWYPIYGPNKPKQLIDALNLKGFEVYWPLRRQSAYTLKGCGLLASPDISDFLDPLAPSLLQFAKLIDCQFSMNSPR